MPRVLDNAEPRSILEIGGGYDRTAYTLLSRYPRAVYTIVDIEPAHTISAGIVGVLWLWPVRSLSPEEAGRLESGSVDLAVSISSLQEMTWPQVASYLTLIDRTAAAGGTVFLKQWATWETPDDDIRLHLNDYSFPARWRLTLQERAPVQTRFTQAAWRLP